MGVTATINGAGRIKVHETETNFGSLEHVYGGLWQVPLDQDPREFEPYLSTIEFIASARRLGFKAMHGRPTFAALAKYQLSSKNDLLTYYRYRFGCDGPKPTHHYLLDSSIVTEQMESGIKIPQLTPKNRVVALDVLGLLGDNEIAEIEKAADKKSISDAQKMKLEYIDQGCGVIETTFRPLEVLSRTFNTNAKIVVVTGKMVVSICGDIHTEYSPTSPSLYIREGETIEGYIPQSGCTILEIY